MKKNDYDAIKQYAFKMIQKRLAELGKSGYWLYHNVPSHILGKGRVYDILKEKQSVNFRLDELISLANALDVDLRYLLDPTYELE